MKKIQMSLCLALIWVAASALAPVLAPNASNAHGTFQATLSSDGKTLNYTLTWTQFGSSVLFAHIHFAMRGVNGGIMAFLCGGGGKPGCAGGTAAGTITMADIVAVPAQEIAVNDFIDFLRAIQAGDAYVNIHTTNFPGGEIRGQIKVLP
jgi:hypothetical protein